MTYNVFGETLNLTLSIYAAPHMLPLFVAIPPLGEPCSLLIPKIRVWDGGGRKSKSISHFCLAHFFVPGLYD